MEIIQSIKASPQPRPQVSTCEEEDDNFYLTGVHNNNKNDILKRKININFINSNIQ